MLQQTLERPEAEPARPLEGSRGEPGDGSDPGGRRRHARGIAAIAIAPFLVLIVRAAHVSWTATGDYALIELRTRDVATSSTPLVGPYSRFGWNHPGPALFYAFAVPYRLFASHGTGLLAGAALIGAVSTVTIVVVMIRRSPSVLVAAFGLLLFASTVRTLGAGFLWDPWNPYVIVLPFLAFVCLAWWAATGEARALPFALGFGSFVVQTHVSLGLEVAVLLLLALAWLTVSAREPLELRRLRRAKRASLVVLAVIWIPPAIQEFLPGGGNIGELLRFWTQSHRNAVGFGRAAHLIGPDFALPAPWLTRGVRIMPLTGGLATPHFSFPFALVALGVATVFAWRRRDRVAFATCSIAASAAVAGWLTFARIIGTPYPYLVVWARVIGPVCWFAAGAVLLPLLAAHVGPATTRWITRTIAVGAATMLVLVTAWSFTTSGPDALDNRAASTLFTSMEPALRRLPAPMVIENQFGYSSNAVAGGLIASSVEHGIDARYSSHVRIMAGDDHVVNPGSARTYVYVVINREVAVYTRDPAWRRIGFYDSLTSAQRADYERLASGANDPADARRFASLERRSLLVGVFVRRSSAAISNSA